MTRRKNATAAPAVKTAKLSFRRPVWPERACRSMIPGKFAYHSCEVAEAHLGPHASYDVAESVAARAAWEAENPDRLGQRAPGLDPFV